MESLEDQVAVITGGASGNGRAIAIEFAKRGARAVILADIREEPREGGITTTQRVEELGSHAIFIKANVREAEAIGKAISAADPFGGVTVMVNNAGVLEATPFLDVTQEELNRIIDINVKGCFYGIQYAAQSMLTHGNRGSIINVSSTAALRGSGELSTYSMSKGAVQTLTYATASALGPRGIRVNTLNPGVIHTQMTESDVLLTDDSYLEPIPLGRFGVPDDVAHAAAFLASPASAYINGSALVVDGGATYGDR